MPYPSHAAAVPLAAIAIIAAGCDRPGYAHDTPDAALDAAQAMIADGRADQLVTLMYAEDEAQRSLLNQVGQLLGSMQRLAEAVEQRFPEEIAAFRAEAEAAAKENRASSWARYLLAGQSGPRRGGFGVAAIDREGLTLDTGADPAPAGLNPLAAAPQMDESTRGIINDLLKQIFADPYRWLEEGRGKLSTQYIADDMVAVLWEGRTIAPPLGVVMRDAPEGWQVVIPWNLPGISQIKPRNPDEYLVFGSIFKTAQNVVDDLTAEVRGGGVRNLTDLADEAVEKAALPAVMIFVAYANLKDQRDKEDQRRAPPEPVPEPQPDQPSPPVDE